MDFPGAFTLFQSPIGTVRVEPPDQVLVDGPTFGPLRFGRASVRECRPMVVSYYQQHIDRAYTAPDPDAIVVQLEIEGMPRALLGPFPHRDGVALGDAINRARGTLLFATADFSIGVSSDDASLVVDTRGPMGRVTVPIPTATLTGMAPRDNANIDAQHTIPTGALPASSRFLELSLTDGKPWIIGPLAPADAANITFAFRKWRMLHPLDALPRTEATPRANPEHGNGHIGMSPGELRVEALDPDGLTGLPKRSNFDALVRRSLESGPGAFAIVAIDKMKLINDYNGFQVGDEVIRKVAQTTRHVLRGTDFAVRWASDQIGILFSDVMMRGAHEMLSNVLAAVRALEVKPGLRVTLSAGMAAIEPGCDVDRVTRLVEDALIAAKRAGRDRIVAA